MKVYEVIYDYSTDDCEDVSTYIFDSYEKAFNKMTEIIEHNKKYNDWIKQAFSNNEIENYEFETNIEDNQTKCDLYWNITNKYDWYEHICLDLQIKGVM